MLAHSGNKQKWLLYIIGSSSVATTFFIHMHTTKIPVIVTWQKSIYKDNVHPVSPSKCRLLCTRPNPMLQHLLSPTVLYIWQDTHPSSSLRKSPESYPTSKLYNGWIIYTSYGREIIYYCRILVVYNKQTTLTGDLYSTIWAQLNTDTFNPPLFPNPC